MSPSKSNQESCHTLILLRHGESEWNNDNRFCGWVDVDLSARGHKEAETAAKAIAESGHLITKIYTSMLRRAHQTVENVLKETKLCECDVVKDWRLNERHYGALTGLNKAECVKSYGAEQVRIWRRSYDIRPPAMKSTHPFYQVIVTQEENKGILVEDDIPESESLKDLIEKRTVPFWSSVVQPDILAGETILCVAHGTSLRGIVKHLEKLSEDEICNVDLPNGIPIVYRLDENLNLVCPREYLADEITVEKAIEKVSNVVRK